MDKPAMRCGFQRIGPTGGAIDRLRCNVKNDVVRVSSAKEVARGLRY